MIFGAPIAGSLATVQDPSAGSILIARKLTPSVVHALTNDHTAVLTCRGGFACHGANILRVVRKDRLKDVTWVTDLPDEITLIPSGTQCEVLAGGTVVIASSAPIETHSRAPVSELIGLLPSGALIRCYWPDRVYDRFSASMMLSGLSEDLRTLGFDGEAIHGPDRLIWFQGNTPTSVELLDNAQLSSALGRHTITRQRNIYSSIVRELRLLDDNDGGLDVLAEICRKYFSCFLLHHRTYSDVILRALEVLADVIQSDEDKRSLMDRLLGTELVQWYSSLPFLLSLRKDFIEEPLVVPIPPFSLEDEISRAESLLADDFEQMRLPPHVLETLFNMARLCILKEWKFILNKLITSRVSERLRRLSIDADSIRRYTIGEVLTLYRASEDTHRLH